MSIPLSAREFLREQAQKASPDSLDDIVVRHLLDCVERFGEDAMQEAVRVADVFIEIYLRRAQTAALNDEFRRDPSLGRFVITAGVQALGKDTVAVALKAVREFDAFMEDNDPWGEHDFGSFETDGHRFFWKIDYYGRDLRVHSPDPTNPKLTCRVLTLMLAEEY